MIRAKSVKGYRSSNRKWTENKFKVSCGTNILGIPFFKSDKNTNKADEAKPEVLEDWDPRFVVTTLSCSQEGDVRKQRRTCSPSGTASSPLRWSKETLKLIQCHQDEAISVLLPFTFK